MDRRLQPTSGAYADSLARRVLALEQRLDLQGARPRWQSQRFFNAPYCICCPPWTITTANTTTCGFGDSIPGGYTFTVESLATTFHAEGLYLLNFDADDFVLTATLQDDVAATLWTETFTFPTTTDGTPWTFDATPNVTVPVGGTYLLTGDGGYSSEMTTALVLESCGDSTVASFIGGG